MTTNQTGSATMKAETRHEIAKRLRGEAIHQLTVSFRRARDLMGDDFAYDWLADQMRVTEEAIAKHHAAFGLPAPESEETAAKLNDLLAEAEVERDSYREALQRVAAMGGAASLVAGQALGEEIGARRVQDVMERAAVDDDMPQPPTMQ